MTKRKLTFISILVVIFLGILYGIYYFFVDMNRLPQGEYLNQATSLNGAYTVKSYLVNNALSPDAVRCELQDNKTNHIKTIYWGYRESCATIIWKDDNIVVINGRELNIKKNDKYDFRHN